MAATLLNNDAADQVLWQVVPVNGTVGQPPTGTILAPGVRLRRAPRASQLTR